MLIEQVLFAADSSNPQSHYRLVAASPGIPLVDLRELGAWTPVRGSPHDFMTGTDTVSFYPLPSGAWCVARTAVVDVPAAEPERSATLSFVVQADGLERFANNPFALLRAIRAAGLLAPNGAVARPLAPFQLPGRASAVDEGLVAQFVDRWGPRRIAWLVESAISCDALAVVGVERREALLAGLLNCLPAECRPEISFSTGLVHSSRRSIRVAAVQATAEERSRLDGQAGLTVLDLSDDPPADFVPTGWANYVHSAFASDRLAAFCRELELARPGLRISDLSWLADQLLERLDDDREPSNTPGPSTRFQRSLRGGAAARTSNNPANAAGKFTRFDGRKLPAGGVDYANRVAGPSATLAAPTAAVMEKFELLDDLVFDTINGKQPALNQLSTVWPKLSAELPPDLLAESREQYLRYALKLWDDKQSGAVRDLNWASTALDVLSVLFDG